MRPHFAKILILAFLVNFLSPSTIKASEIILPKPGTMVHLSPAMNPPVLQGIKVHPNNPFKFDFIMNNGNSVETPFMASDQDEPKKLIKYFLAALTTPEKDMWVNLSPYEKDRIVPDSFGQTEMGRDLLAQDYLLKQITASLVYPEGDIGKTFWKRVYELSSNKNIPINTFNKVWIVPNKAVVYENPKNGTAYIVQSSLKVMTEQDYVAENKNTVETLFIASQTTNKTTQNVIREIVIPQLTKEVKEGANFAQLRQVYNSLILAAWYKKKIKNSVLSQVYADKNKVAGVNIDDPQEKQKIYARYLEAFKKGAYNYIKDEQDPITRQSIPRKYFSGGLSMAMSRVLQVNNAMSSTLLDKISKVGLATIAVTMLTAGTLSQNVYAQPRNAAEVLKYFDINSNAITGFSPSNFGDTNPEYQYAAMTYDLSLRAIADAGRSGVKIITTFAKNTTQSRGEALPATLNNSYDPGGGLYTSIRIKNFEEPNWWKNWEFKISAGDNAWAGIAAMHNYVRTKDAQFLRFAEERANFIMKLQDEDGGVRFGPKGQSHESGDTALFWKIKSTENNNSALHFFDMLYAVTNDTRYSQAADRIYNWIITTMYDKNTHTIARASNFFNGRWEKDDPNNFAPDAVTWVPLKRVLNDPRFGATRLERLNEFEKILEQTEKFTGVYEEGTLKGISFASSTKSQNVISPEWSSQLAVLYWKVSQEFLSLQRETTSKVYVQKYENLVKQIGGFFKKRNGEYIAPYAVFANGEIAVNIPTGHGWNTPNSYASVANVYYAFALDKFDPLLLNQAMTGKWIIASVIVGGAGIVGWNLLNERHNVVENFANKARVEAINKSETPLPSPPVTLPSAPLSANVVQPEIETKITIIATVDEDLVKIQIAAGQTGFNLKQLNNDGIEILKKYVSKDGGTFLQTVFINGIEGFNLLKILDAKLNQNFAIESIDKEEFNFLIKNFPPIKIGEALEAMKAWNDDLANPNKFPIIGVNINTILRMNKNTPDITFSEIFEQLFGLKPKVDKAQLTQGGIDFNADKLNLQLQNNTGDIKFNLDPAMLKQLQNAPGFTPIIINIQPMTDLKLFLGLSETASVLSL